ncbi:metal-independent alpha-mannosidase [Sphingomonas sp. IBVSS2]|uniref:glycoside hydrolase family 125 protein n=1 Tax=Sphingomonas sp. IBVSS2 TaxID=1985172 RepID=UPI000A2D3056|nr:glycoside hydrolase family 125 protein [Sphingomonas sp. IBVSS2]OSZ62617.1 metal-independent alpha-mannosidase [Sphingomonas sp. IBVSS2]
MMDRRSMLAAGLAFAAPRPAWAMTPSFASQRPPIGERRFTSPAVEREIARVSARIGDPKLAWMFANAWPNTLDTTVLRAGEQDSFVVTGDIPCLWLRDSSAQMKPYLHLAREDARLAMLLRGLIARHARSVLIDPYANAFMEDPLARTSLSWAVNDDTEMKPGVAERKWEVDSLCYVIRLGHQYWRATGDTRPFDATWAQAMRAILRTFREQQRKTGPGPYRFRRNAPQPTETLLWSTGNPTRPIGLIHSGFRPSDDACLYSFLIPSNLFAVTALRELAELCSEARPDPVLAAEALALAAEVSAALRAHGTMRLPDGRRVWAYEVDGYGNAVFLDDANVPSLSGLAYLGCAKPNDALWRRTADAAWSEANPWFFKGRAAEGIGGPHVGSGQVWPMSLIVRALSARDDATIRRCLKTLRDTDADTGFVHEAFDKDDPSIFTRKWFAWANGLFGELIVHLADVRPQILKEPL